LTNSKRHLCPDCLSDYKRSDYGIRERKKRKRGINAQWGRMNWPKNLFHAGKTRKCLYHHLMSILSGAKRRVLKLQALPSWANTEKIKQVYIDRINKELVTGKKYHVDHIVPLQGKNVCGLHVEHNLQILPAAENIKKSNKFNSLQYGNKDRVV